MEWWKLWQTVEYKPCPSRNTSFVSKQNYITKTNHQGPELVIAITMRSWIISELKRSTMDVPLSQFGFLSETMLLKMLVLSSSLKFRYVSIVVLMVDEDVYKL